MAPEIKQKNISWQKILDSGVFGQKNLNCTSASGFEVEAFFLIMDS